MQHVNDLKRDVPSSIGLYAGRLTAVALSAVLSVWCIGCTTATPGGNRAAFDAPTGSPNPVADQAGEGGGAAVARDIEEADIVKVAGDKLYALNRYRGLLIVDVADPDNLALLGTLDLRGRGIEMYVDGGNVYVILSADYYIPYALGAGGGAELAIAPDGPVPQAPDFEGSKVAVVDVSDPTTPEIRTQLELAGWAGQSRRVGDILYIAGSNFIPWGYEAWVDDAEEIDEGFVASISIADPENVTAVERKTFGGNSMDIHVSDTAIFAAGREYDYVNAFGSTNVQIIDISDPAGAIVMRGAFDVPGFIDNRFYMDDYEDVFRIVTQSSGFGVREVKLFTYDIADLDDVQPLGEVGIIEDESLQAVRFDGPRGYAVTFFVIDPLFTLDLSDPANPTVSGELEVPGFSTHIEPRGDRLIAVGIDDTDGSRPAVSYYDVTDPANPTQLGRVVLGPPGSYTESDAVYDEKAFKIVDEIGLIAIPFRHWAGTEIMVNVADSPNAAADEIRMPECVSGVQLIDFSDTDLTQRGYFEHRGLAQRVGMIGDRLFALSQASMQSVDITDRDNPVKTSEVDFFDAAELPYYADDCGGWYPIVIDVPGADISGLIEMLRQAGMCGTAVPGAALAMMFALTMVKLRFNRRRRR